MTTALEAIFANENVVLRISGLWLFPLPVASALALVFRELKELNPSQHFAFSAGKHLDSAKSPGIPKMFAELFSFYARI